MDTSTRMLSTAEMAIRYGVTLRSLHFFEQSGLLQPVRTGSTWFYAPKDQLRLEVILRGQHFGFSLLEIRKLIEYTSGAREKHSSKPDTIGVDTLVKQALAQESSGADLEIAAEKREDRSGSKVGDCLGRRRRSSKLRSR